MKTYILCCLFFWIGIISAYGQVDTLLDVGSYKLHIKILKGKGAPILFESGGALDARQWDSISNILYNKLNATIITYDRQGFGKSELDTSKYTILDEVKGLEIAIKKLGYANKNILLACHSLGTFYSSLYAFRHPHLVKGIIMLDPRLPSLADMRFARSVFTKIKRSDFRREDIGLYYVLARMEKNSDFIRGKNIPPNIPVLGIMAEQGPFDDKEENDRFQSDLKNLIGKRINANLVRAPGSSHNIPLDKPDLVISEISNFYKKYLNQSK
ncbi:hypothetical protein DBR40_00255 [Pedobacter sp. KBW01]|uniref:alpha/beta fold hydrolase n=1 Tax=Pedobacter sp. KBW01 TaxID=2153364 RepID=UPI000F5A03B0|nr:alpha/beta hydrolase [Pedobacter sp. KBW01]RQO80088.1 hypothetical protein DBR40_00255 [Pedobacter sp. KBW01]